MSMPIGALQCVQLSTRCLRSAYLVGDRPATTGPVRRNLAKPKVICLTCRRQSREGTPLRSQTKNP